MPGNASPKIAHLVHSLSGGGTERMLVSLLRRLPREGPRHIVITMREPGTLAGELPDHVACRPMNVGPKSRTAWITLSRILRETGCGIVHARNTGCWMDAILATQMVSGTSLVLGFHGLETGALFSARHRWIARAGRLCGARFVSVSDCGRRQLMDQLMIPAESVEVLPNGVDRRRFAPGVPGDAQAMRRALGIDSQDLVVGMVGSLTPVKGHDVALRALQRTRARDRRLKLLIVGDGPLRATLSALAENLGIVERVLFAGPREDVPRLMGAMDTMLCASRSEGMCNAVLEAMASGLPIIATDVGDNRKLMGDGQAGLIVAEGSVEELATAILRVAGDPELRTRMGEAARSHSSLYDLQAVVERYRTYYDELSRGQSSRPRTENASLLGLDAVASPNTGCCVR